MPEIIRILLAESHPLILSGIQAVIAQMPDLDLVGAATTVKEIGPICQKRRPNVLLLGITLSDLPFTAVLAQAQQNCPELRALVLLSEDENICLQQLSENGAAGGIFRSELPDALLTAIHTITQGELWFSPRLVKRMLQPESPTLTDEELALLRLMVAGETDKAIADAASLSPRTLRRRLKQICDKLGVETRIEIEAAYLAGLHRLFEE